MNTTSDQTSKAWASCITADENAIVDFFRRTVQVSDVKAICDGYEPPTFGPELCDKLTAPLMGRAFPSGLTGFDIEMIFREASIRSNADSYEVALATYAAWFTLRAYATWQGNPEGRDRLIASLCDYATRLGCEAAGPTLMFMMWLRERWTDNKFLDVSIVILYLFCARHLAEAVTDRILEKLARSGEASMYDLADSGGVQDAWARAASSIARGECDLVASMKRLLNVLRIP